jgi:hypothetical protein
MSARLSHRVVAAVVVAASPFVVVWCTKLAYAAGQNGPAPTQAADKCPVNEAALFHACVTSRTSTYDPPRTPDGKPDMQGWWQAPLGGTQNIEEHPRTPATAPGKSLIVDPPSGHIPYQPWAEAQIKELAKTFVEPNAACFPSGSPRSVYTPGGFQIRQSPGYVVLLFDRAHNYRIIPTDGRPHLGSSLVLWQGDPRGRWDGNTLVVDVSNQNGRTWLDQQGRFGTDALHVVERFKYLDEDTMHFQATVEDPNVYSRPWTIAFPLRRDKRRSRTEFIDDACFEGDETTQMLFKLGYHIYSGTPARPAR